MHPVKLFIQNHNGKMENKKEKKHITSVCNTSSCDCVGILKERNVDVEHRFKAVVSRGRKKSTKCRLVFRTCITLSNGAQETLQVVSQPIACSK